MIKETRILALVLLTTLTLSIFGLPGGAKEEGIGEIIEAENEVTVYREGRELTLKEKAPLLPGDLIVSKEFPVLFALGPHRVYLNPHTIIRLTEHKIRERDVESRIFLKTGRVWAWIMKAASRMVNFEIETETALAGVRGTVFAVDFNAENGATWVYVDEGEVEVADKRERKVKVRSGYEIFVHPGQPLTPPQKRKLMKEEKPDFKKKASEAPTNQGKLEVETSGENKAEVKKKKKVKN